LSFPSKKKPVVSEHSGHIPFRCNKKKETMGIVLGIKSNVKNIERLPCCRNMQVKISMQKLSNNGIKRHFCTYLDDIQYVGL